MYFGLLLSDQLNISRLSLPYVDCQEEQFDLDGAKSDYKYSTRECNKQCLQLELFTKCGCVTEILDNRTLCSVVDKAQGKVHVIVKYDVVS